MKFLTRAILLIGFFGASHPSLHADGKNFSFESVKWLYPILVQNTLFAQAYKTAEEQYHVLLAISKIQLDKNAQQPSPIIQSIADTALHDAGIKSPVVVLECKENMRHHTTSCEVGSTKIQYLIVATGGCQTLKQIVASIYHEVGHIAHGDLRPVKLGGFTLMSSKIKNGLSFFGAGIASFTIVPSMVQRVQKIVGNEYAAGFLVASGFAVCLCLTIDLVHKFMERREEKRADEFGWNLLITKKRPDVVVESVVEYNLYASNKESWLSSLLSTHPTHSDRASAARSILKKHGIDDTYVQSLYCIRYRQMCGELAKESCLKPYIENRFTK